MNVGEGVAGLRAAFLEQTFQTITFCMQIPCLLPVSSWERSNKLNY